MRALLTLLFLIIFLSATPLSRDDSSKSYFVVWNVGQGQWTTWVQSTECWHFDMGGEFFNWQKVRNLCGYKPNRVSLSHWDLDHIGALKKAPKYLPNLCLDAKPIGKATLAKERLMPKKACPPENSVSNSVLPSVLRWRPRNSQSTKSNELSQVFVAAGFLLPGDSTSKEELLWATELPLKTSRVLILGHHGSRTSTSEYLLNHLPNIKIAVSSARWKRYKHPHAEVLALLHKHKIPILRTEDWGSLWFEI